VAPLVVAGRTRVALTAVPTVKVMVAGAAAGAPAVAPAPEPEADVVADGVPARGPPSTGGLPSTEAIRSWT
jgi:hypothetical protein